jgi:hypothetical protein
VVQAIKEKILGVHKELGKLTKSNDTAKIGTFYNLASGKCGQLGNTYRSGTPRQDT